MERIVNLSHLLTGEQSAAKFPFRNKALITEFKSCRAYHKIIRSVTYGDSAKSNPPLNPMNIQGIFRTFALSDFGRAV